MTRLTEPAIHLLLDWLPTGPDSFEALYGETILKLEFERVINAWRWSCHGSADTTAYGFKASRGDAMLAALAWAGHPAARTAVGL